MNILDASDLIDKIVKDLKSSLKFDKEGEYNLRIKLLELYIHAHAEGKSDNTTCVYTWQPYSGFNGGIAHS